MSAAPLKAARAATSLVAVVALGFLPGHAAAVDNNIHRLKTTVPGSPDLGPHRPHGQFSSDAGPAYVVDVGPQRPHGQSPPPSDTVEVYTFLDDDLSRRPPHGPDLGPHRPAGQNDHNGPPHGDLGPQRPHGQFPPDAAAQEGPVVSRRQPPPGVDLGPHRPAGLSDPNGPPGANGDLGAQRPHGQYPPAADIAKARSKPPLGVDLGPHRTAGLIDPNGPPGGDLGPQRPHGQFPPVSAALEDDDYGGGGGHAFKVFWNVPSFMCHRYGLEFGNLTGRYGIVQNQGDVFRGTHIAILYDPGLFPAFIRNNGEVKARNGGVPQEGDLALHLVRLQESIEDQIPADFDGLGVIDFEAWRPKWAQNFGTLRIYQQYSIRIEKQRDPLAPDSVLLARATLRFEAAAKEFFLLSLRLAQSLRPNGRWGYYAFPYCFNSNNDKFDCSDTLRSQNSQMQWLFDASTALYPSVYLSKAGRSSDDQFLFIRSKLREAARVARGRNVVYPYLWYRYRDAGYLSDDDLSSCVALPRAMGLAGAVLWGSSGDMNTQAKCQSLDAQLDSRLGPTVRTYAVTLSDERVRQYVRQRAANAA